MSQLVEFGSDRRYTGPVPSAWMRVFAVIRFVRKPAEALSPKGADPRQLRGLVSGGSLRVGSSWVSNGVGRRYSATEPCAVSPSDQARAYGLRRRRESAPGSARPNVLWFGQPILPSARHSKVGCSAKSPRVGSPLMSCACGGRRTRAGGQTEGSRRTDGGAPKEASAPKGVRTPKEVRRGG